MFPFTGPLILMDKTQQRGKKKDSRCYKRQQKKKKARGGNGNGGGGDVNIFPSGLFRILKGPR